MSKKQNFLVVDTETGGLSCDEHSILSFAGVAWSVDGEPVKCFDLYIKEDDIKYIPKALEINKIKLDELKQVGVSPKEAVLKVREGLDKVFIAAGFEWREPGCSMCLAMNADKLTEGERCASTSNRNFEGRQGRGGRTHLVSPQMAVAAALAGHLADVRDI